MEPVPEVTGVPGVSAVYQAYQLIQRLQVYQVYRVYQMYQGLRVYLRVWWEAASAPASGVLPGPPCDYVVVQAPLVA